MSVLQGALSLADRSMRSVYVGNIPYGATEEQLKVIFSKVGLVVSFRMAFDRDTAKPKGFGFCEYRDQESAISAMRNLNGFEMNGHGLRVISAASEKNKEEFKNLQVPFGMPSVEGAKDATGESEKAPEEISKAVASLPPEEMFELMKQMKLCIQNNPNEARNLLLQNPQLAYALLQAQVVMKIVDPHVALSILNRPMSAVPARTDPGPSQPPAASGPSQVPGIPTTTTFPPNEMASTVLTTSAIHAPPRMPLHLNPTVGNPQMPMPQFSGEPPPAIANPIRLPGPMNQFLGRGMPMMDPRAMGDRDLRQHAADQDLRMPPGLMPGGDKDMRQMVDQDLRQMPGAPTVDARPFDPRFRGKPGDPSGQGPAGFDRQRPTGPAVPYDPRTRAQPRRAEDPRTTQSGIRPGRPVPPAPQVAPGPGPQMPPGAGPQFPSAPGLPPEQEKAALIMQVLQLSDEQISMLPQEQQQSIMVLKEQLARQAR